MSASNTPLLLLDVDGVLNALGHPVEDGWEMGRFNGYTLTWDTTITARLRQLHEDGRVEIQWLTTWCEDADKLLAKPMGLPRGLVTHSKHHHAGSRREWWKFTHAREIAEQNPGRPIVWIDDDHHSPYDTDVTAWLKDHPEVYADCPKLELGLTHKRLDDIEVWLDSWSG